MKYLTNEELAALKVGDVVYVGGPPLYGHPTPATKLVVSRFTKTLIVCYRADNHRLVRRFRRADGLAYENTESMMRSRPRLRHWGDDDAAAAAVCRLLSVCRKIEKDWRRLSADELRAACEAMAPTENALNGEPA